jgi:hypothetical protein
MGFCLERKQPSRFGGSPLCDVVSSFLCTHIQTEKISSWNGPTVHICCFMLARASNKTFVSRVRKTAKKSSLAENSLAGSLVSRGITVFVCTMELIAALWTVSRCSIILSQLLCTSNCSPFDENCFDDFVLIRTLQMCSTEDVVYGKDNV